MIRLHASGPTVRAFTQASGIKFLVSNGIDKRKNAPLVFVDQTSFSANSQSTAMMKFATAHRETQGYSKKHISQNLGFASTGGFNDGTSWSYTDARDVARLKDNYQNSRVLDVSIANNGNPKLTYLSFWNGSYTSSVKKHTDGSLRGDLSSKFKNSAKIIVLATMYEAMRSASSSKFHKAVEKAAQNLGYKFPPPNSIVASVAVAASPDMTPAQFTKANKEMILALAQDQLLARLSPSQKPEIGQSLGLDVMIAEGLAPRWNTQFFKYFTAEMAKHKSTKWEDEKTQKLIVNKYLEQLMPNPSSSDTLAFAEFVSLLKKNPEQEKYYSENGTVIHDWLSHSFKLLGANDIATFIAGSSDALVTAFDDHVITSKDIRRLYLYMLSFVSPRNTRNIAKIGQSISNNSDLKSMFEERSEVFLTSDRFDGKAKPVYLALVKAGYLAPVKAAKSCKKLLSEEREQ